MRIIDQQTKSLLHAYEHPRRVRCVAFDSNGDRVASACHDGCLRIFCARTGTVQHTIGHGSTVRVYAVAFGGHEQHGEQHGHEIVVTGDTEGRIRIVDADNGELLCQETIVTDRTQNAIYSVSVDTTGKLVALGCEDAMLRILKVHSSDTAQSSTELQVTVLSEVPHAGECVSGAVGICLDTCMDMRQACATPLKALEIVVTNTGMRIPVCRHAIDDVDVRL